MSQISLVNREGFELAPVGGARRELLLGFLLQLSHRAGAVAMMLFVGVLAMLYLGQDFHLVLAGAFGVSNIGLCAALGARVVASRRLIARSEAVGAAVFNGVIFAMSLQLMVISRLDVLRAAGATFFNPR